MMCVPLGLALGRKRPGASDSAVDPLDELLVGFQVLGADAQPSGHRPAAGFGGVTPDQGTALTAGADRHIAAYQECQAAEHLPLGYARPGCRTMATACCWVSPEPAETA